MSILDNTKFMFAVCEMFYMQGLSQKEIAGKLNISRPQISRIIANAKENNLVSIHLNYENPEENHYQQLIKDRFNVPQVYVYDIGDSSKEDAIQRLAESSKDLFDVVIKNNEKVGVMAGRTISALSSAIGNSKNRGLEFVALCGDSFSDGEDWNVNSIVQKFASKTHGKSYTFSAPRYLNSAATKSLLLGEPSIMRILELGKQCDVALLGIGNIELDSTGIVAGNLSNSDLNKLREDGAVANICSSYIDKEGNVIPSHLENKILGQSILDIISMRKVGIAVGKEKTEAIKAVLKGAFLDTFITSLDTAIHLLGNEKYKGD
ncbi:MAG: sugar-binding domain-containing protein [Sphaerochaeta sp.]|nr:sugar-binding domain-containing protein [Sphaerochaeta sp.]